MELMIFIGGVLVGITIYHICYKVINKNYKIYGVIDVDHSNELCKVRITSDELSDRKSKKAVFVINHDARISREEQLL